MTVNGIGLPEAFLDEMRTRLGESFGAFLAAYGEPPVRGVRFSALKTPAVPFVEGLGAGVPWEERGYELSPASAAGRDILHEAGAYYLQEPSAMLPARVLDVRPGETVLDLCAAPGGKSTQLGDALQGEGILVANEIVPHRAQILSRNLERMGTENSFVVSESPDALAARWPGAFDAVLADAPCSGEGMFRRHPETRAQWSPSSVEGCARRQRDILACAAVMVRCGGRLVYSTCTLNPRENEENVRWFLSAFPEFEPEPFTLPGADGKDGYVTLYPHEVRGEGQFAARFRKRGSGKGALPLMRPVVLGAGEKAALEGFGLDLRSPVFSIGSVLFTAPLCPDLSRLRVLRCGKQLGELRKGRFQPDHALAVSAHPPAIPSIALTRAQALMYLRGEAVGVEENAKGYVLACFAQWPLGFGKVTDHLMKNHYPKGLRRDLERAGDEQEEL